MALLPALMVLVSCSDGFADCALADKIAAYPTAAACEAQLSKTLAAAGQKQEYLLARCVAAPAAGNAENARENTAENAASQAEGNLAEIAWQVSKHGDLLAQVKSAEGGAAEQSPLYAENIGSRGGGMIEQSAIALAMAEQEGDKARSEGSARPRRSSMLALFRAYSGKKAKPKQAITRRAPAEAAEESASIAGYSAKYIYETDNFSGSGYSLDTGGMDIVWGNQLPISEASFEIETPKERFYALNPQIAAVLRAPAAEGMLPAGNYFTQSGAPYQKMFRQDMFEEKAAPAAKTPSAGLTPGAGDKDGSGEPAVTARFMA